MHIFCIRVFQKKVVWFLIQVFKLWKSKHCSFPQLQSLLCLKFWYQITDSQILRQIFSTDRINLKGTGRLLKFKIYQLGWYKTHSKTPFLELHNWTKNPDRAINFKDKFSNLFSENWLCSYYSYTKTLHNT